MEACMVPEVKASKAKVVWRSILIGLGATLIPVTVFALMRYSYVSRHEPYSAQVNAKGFPEFTAEVGGVVAPYPLIFFVGSSERHSIKFARVEGEGEARRLMFYRLSLPHSYWGFGAVDLSPIGIDATMHVTSLTTDVRLTYCIEPNVPPK